MKKNIPTLLICLFIFTNAVSEAQEKGTIKIKKPEPEVPAKPVKDSADTGDFFDLLYGYKVFTGDFQGKFNTLDHFKMEQPLQLIGIGFSDLVTISRQPRRYYMHIYYTQVVPHSLKINDSINCKITGGTFSYALGGYLATKSENFWTGLYLGFNTGRLRFYGEEIVRQKNPFFSPKIGIQSKLVLGKFSIGLLIEAEYDVSKINWRKTLRANSDKITIQQFRQTGFTTLININYKLIHYAKQKDGVVDENLDF